MKSSWVNISLLIRATMIKTPSICPIGKASRPCDLDPRAPLIEEQDNCQ